MKHVTGMVHVDGTPSDPQARRAGHLKHFRSSGATGTVPPTLCLRNILRPLLSVDSHPRRRLAARLVAWAGRPAARRAVAAAPQRPASPPLCWPTSSLVRARVGDRPCTSSRGRPTLYELAWATDLVRARVGDRPCTSSRWRPTLYELALKTFLQRQQSVPSQSHSTMTFCSSGKL